jgi:hypothetical protein
MVHRDTRFADLLKSKSWLKDFQREAVAAKVLGELKSRTL